MYCRLLHSPYLYRFIHKRHHEWTAPIAVTAMYCHPFENIFSNVLPIFLGVFIMGSHVATAWLWFSLAILFTLNSHSGYHLPFLPSPEAHDFHHLKYVVHVIHSVLLHVYLCCLYCVSPSKYSDCAVKYWLLLWWLIHWLIFTFLHES